jgi:hypothetical protein
VKNTPISIRCLSNEWSVLVFTTAALIECAKSQAIHHTVINVERSSQQGRAWTRITRKATQTMRLHTKFTLFSSTENKHDLHVFFTKLKKQQVEVFDILLMNLII